MKGIVFDISRACYEDGPGLRTVIFLKGCPLDCPWCHNLEGKSFAPEISFEAAACLGCGECRKACPRGIQPAEWGNWREGCRGCGKCAEACPSRARLLVGREFEAEELAREASRDEDFFRGTGGGVTFSGGEPLAQPEFVLAAARALREKKIRVAVETSGFWSDSWREQAAEHFDLFLFDLKHMNPEKFRKATRKEIQGILENLKCLIEKGVPLEIRIPLIPGFNNSPDDLREIASFLKGLPRVSPVTLLPFHRLARTKEERFGRKYPYADYPPMSEQELSEARDLLRKEGILSRQ